MARKPPDPRRVARALELLDSGMSIRAVADELRVNAATITRWHARYGAPAEAPVKREDPPAHDPEGPSTILSELDELAAQLERADLRREAATVVEAREKLAILESVDEADNLTQMRFMRSEAMARATAFSRVGNTQGAQRAAQSAAQLANTIARVELSAGDGNAGSISREDIAAGEVEAQAVLKVLLASPPLCAQCGESIRRARATSGGKS